MDIKKEELQREEFRSILFSLAVLDYSIADDDARSKIYYRLEQLYYAPDKAQSYRHFYSDIFIVLTQIQQGDKDGSIAVLGENLRVIRMEYQAINKDDAGNLIDIHDCLKKLYDHVSLDIARISYSDAGDRKLGQKQSIAAIRADVNEIKTLVESTKASVQSTEELVEQTKRQTDEAKKQVSITKESVDTTKKHVDELVTQVTDQVEKVENAQKEYIAILGIFSSVVLTFTAGIAFSTSVLQNIHQSSIYRTVFVSLIIGIVLVNVLYGLFYYVDRLVRPSKERSVNPLWITNLILVVLMLATCYAWYCGIVEKRNVELEAEVYSATEIMETEPTETELMEELPEETTSADEQENKMP